VDEEYRSGLWRKEAAYSGRVTVDYVLGGTFWFLLHFALGSFETSEAPAGLLWFVVPISAIAVHPCSFVTAGILGAVLPGHAEWSRPWWARPPWQRSRIP